MQLGSGTISKAYLGSTLLTKIYLGATEVWTGQAAAPVITFGTATYDRGAAGVSPSLIIPDLATENITGGTFMLYIATRSSASGQLSKSNIENGTGDALDHFSIGPEAVIADLDSAGLDLATSLTSGNIDFFYEHSDGATSDVGTVGGVDYDAVAPAFASAVIENAAPSTVVMTLTKASYDPGGVIDAADFPLTGATITAASLETTTTIHLTLASPAESTDDFTGDLSYTGDYLVGIDAEVMPTFAGQSVTNNVEAGTEVTGEMLTEAGAALLAEDGSVMLTEAFTGTEMSAESGDDMLTEDDRLMLTEAA